MPESYEVITAWHVVEHLHSPSRFFLRVASLLRAGGRFCMSVPNLDSYKGRWLKAEDVPRHLHFFTLQSLKAYGERYGLDITRVSYSSALANGPEGRGSFTRYVYKLGGLSLYDYLSIENEKNRTLQRRFPFLYQLARPLAWLERRVLTAKRLEKSGHMGVIAIEYTKRPLG